MENKFLVLKYKPQGIEYVLDYRKFNKNWKIQLL